MRFILGCVSTDHYSTFVIKREILVAFLFALSVANRSSDNLNSPINLYLRSYLRIEIGGQLNGSYDIFDALNDVKTEISLS